MLVNNRFCVYPGFENISRFPLVFSTNVELATCEEHSPQAVVYKRTESFMNELTDI
jgi:hypothetical protein